MGLRDRLKESGRKAREKNLQIQKEMEEEKKTKNTMLNMVLNVKSFSQKQNEKLKHKVQQIW